MTRFRILSLVSTLALAACGGKAPPETTTPSGTTEEHAGHEGEGAAAPDEEEDEHADHHHDQHAEHEEHGSGGETPAPPGADKAQLVAAEQAAYEQARPVFEKYCAKCHTQGGPKAKPKSLGHFDMTSYPFGGHHADEEGATIREVLGVTGKKATMPFDKPGAVKGDELALIVAWADAFDKSHATGAHEAHEGDHDHDGDHHEH